MRVLISGQAALAITLDVPRQLYVLDGGLRDAPSDDNFLRLFDGCSDLVEADAVSGDHVSELLEKAWACDRALRLFLLLIDPQEPQEALQEYAHCVQDLLGRDSVHDFVLQRLSTSAFPVMVEIKRVQEAAASCPDVLNLFAHTLDLQGYIRKVIDAYADLSDSLFDSENQKTEFRHDLETEGVFSELAIALQREQDISFIKLKVTSQHIAFREAIAQWTAMLQSGIAKLRSRDIQVLEADDEDDLNWDEYEDAAARPANHDAYAYVRAQQVEITRLLKLRDLDGARAKTNVLIARQRSNSTSEQIAKSLSLLSHQAKLQDIPELQLEWAVRATEENPRDPKTFGHYSDALTTLGRYSDAEHALNEAERAGGRLFAEGGRARILRSIGRYEEARVKYVQIAEEFDYAPEVEYAWMGAADTLKDLGRIDEAIAEYQHLVRRWPLKSFLWTGLAFALLEAGRLDDAISTFSRTDSGRFDKIAATGKAAAFKMSGRFDEALRLYDQVVEGYPNDHTALCGRAEIFRIQGRYQLALAAYEVAIARSPYSSVPLTGRASILMEIGSFAEARRFYQDIAERFPHDYTGALGAIRVLRRTGDFEAALREVDQLISAAPYLVAAKTLRAQLLQARGSFDDALFALDIVTSNHPFNAGAVTAKANLLIAMGKVRDAGMLLSETRPRTQVEWTRFLLRAFVLKEDKGIGAAASHIEWGLTRCPFFSQRRSLRNALVSLELQRKRWRDARRIVESAPAEISNVIALHAFAASHRHGLARKFLEEIRASEPSKNVIILAEEIARRTRLIDERPQYSSGWVTDHERGLILLEAA